MYAEDLKGWIWELTEENPDNTSLSEVGVDNSVGVCGGGVSRITYLGNNSPLTKGEGGVLGYQDGGSGM